MSDRPSGYFWGLAAKEGLDGEGDLNGEPFAPNSIRTDSTLDVSPGLSHPLIVAPVGRLIAGEATLVRSGSDVFVKGQIWTDMEVGSELAKMLRHRPHMGLSLGYRALKTATPTPDQAKRGVRKILTDVLPGEISTVLEPAQPWAMVLECKATMQEVDDRIGALLEKRARELEKINKEMDECFARSKPILRGLARVA